MAIQQTNALLPELPFMFGQTRVVIATKKMTWEMADRIAEAIRDYRLEGTAMEKTPPNPGETMIEWRDRLAKAKAENPDLVEPLPSTRKTNESIDDYYDRLYKPPLKTMSDAYAVVKILCEKFEQPCPSLDDFKKANWPEVRCFIYDCLNLQELIDEAASFSPKEILSGAAQGA